MKVKGKSKKRKKSCLACGKKFGRRSIKGGSTFCSTLCKDSHHVERALVRDTTPKRAKFYTFHTSGHAQSYGPNLQNIPRTTPYHFIATHDSKIRLTQVTLGFDPSK